MFLFWLIFWLLPASPAETQFWLTEPGSQIFINGKTNVNDFSCQGLRNIKTDTLVLEYDDFGKATFTEGKIRIEASKFDCQNRIMNKDFKETINSDSHPFITLELLSIQKPLSEVYYDASFQSKVAITLAGHKKVLPINLILERRGPHTVEMIGKKNLHFTDFNLTPPQKFMGMVKVENEIDVDFKLILTQLN